MEGVALSRPPHERPTARQLASAGEQPMQIAGQRADVCPSCGCAMFANGTRKGESMTFRYVVCRNRSCGKRFLSKQPPATIVREIESDESSSSGQNGLSLYGDVG